MSITSLPDEITQAIAPLRGNIDEIDFEIIRLLGQRIRFVREIGELKKTLGTQVRDHGRENAQMRKIFELSREQNVPPGYTALVFRMIIEASVRIQQGEDAPTTFREGHCICCGWNTSAMELDPDLHWPVCIVCRQPLFF
ncbi:MAG: chorismate mutase [Patescibacteria group bacterium]